MIARRTEAEAQLGTRQDLAVAGEWHEGKVAHYSALTDTIFVEGFGVSSDGTVTDTELAQLRGEVKVDFNFMRFRKSHDVPESEQALVFEMLQRRCNWALQQQEQDEQDALQQRRLLAEAAAIRK